MPEDTLLSAAKLLTKRIKNTQSPCDILQQEAENAIRSYTCGAISETEFRTKIKGVMFKFNRVLNVLSQIGYCMQIKKEKTNV